MKYRRVGRSGLLVSEIGYGNWVTHGSQIDQTRAIECVRAALDCGITYFDTGDVHAEGRGETILGQALRSSDRDGVVISTKAFFPVPPYGPNNAGLGRKHLTASVNNSLRRLGTDVIDIFIAQRFDRNTPLDETFSTLSDLVRQGKVHYIGVSEWTAEQITRGAAMAREYAVPFIASCPQYSMVWRVIEGGLQATCEREGISQLVWAPLAQGVLTGKYRPGEPPPDGSRAASAPGGAELIGEFRNDDLLSRVQRLAEVADDAGLSLAQLALAWTLQNPNVSSAVCGASSPEQIVENCKASGVSLELDVIASGDLVLGRAIETDPRRITSP